MVIRDPSYIDLLIRQLKVKRAGNVVRWVGASNFGGPNVLARYAKCPNPHFMKKLITYCSIPSPFMIAGLVSITLAIMF